MAALPRLGRGTSMGTGTPAICEEGGSTAQEWPCCSFQEPAGSTGGPVELTWCIYGWSGRADRGASSCEPSNFPLGPCSGYFAT